jgi:hypothetical protein
LSLSRLRDVQRFLVEKEMWGLSFVANSSPNSRLMPVDQAVLALGTTSRRRNQDYVFWIAVCIVVTKIDGKRGACNDLG